jgi:hypothetical protein
MLRTKLIPLTLAFATLAPERRHGRPEPDRRRRDAQGHPRLRPARDGRRRKASKVAIKCEPVKKVGQTRPCTGTFDVKLDGKTASYRLTKKARTFRIAPRASSSA